MGQIRFQDLFPDPDPLSSLSFESADSHLPHIVGIIFPSLPIDIIKLLTLSKCWLAKCCISDGIPLVICTLSPTYPAPLTLIPHTPTVTHPPIHPLFNDRPTHQITSNKL